MSTLALQARDLDWGQLVLVVLFVVFPLVARLFKWLGDKVRGEAEPQAGGEDPLERRRRLREERRRAEAEGEDLWRRLARGEAPPTPTAAPLPFPAQPAHRYEGDDVREFSLEDAAEESAEPQPLSMIGEVEERSVVPELSLERAEEPAPLAALAPLSVGAAIPVPAIPLEVPARAPRGMRFDLARDELRRAIVLSEILGPPVSERPLRG